MASWALTSPLAGRSSAKDRRSPFTEYCRAGNVTFLPPLRRSQIAKPISFSPPSGPASASKITSASASFPGGLPDVFGMTRTDTSSVLPFDMESSIGRRGPETDGVGEVRADPGDAAERGWDARPWERVRADGQSRLYTY